MSNDYYAAVGLPRGSSLADIRAAYRALAARFHPDKFCGAPADEQVAANLRMVELNEAISVLGNVVKRSAYDRELKALTLAAARGKGREMRTPSRPSRLQTPVRPADPPAPQVADSRKSDIEKRIAALPARILSVALKWKDLASPAWVWSLESAGGGRPLLIAHKHFDSLESKDTQWLDKAIDRILGERKERLGSPWIVILLSCRRLGDPAPLMLALDVLVKRGRGWLTKRPMIVLYDEGSGRVLKLGEVPEHAYMDRILNLLLHP